MKIESEGWDSLSKESDPDILAYSALRQADRWEASEQSEKAISLLSELSQNPQLAPAFKTKIDQRLSGFQSRSDFGANFEVLLSRLVRETRRPGPMLAMGGASVCFQLSRLALLAKLPSTLATLARPLATVAEAGAFTLAMPVAHQGRGFEKEFLSSLILMGSLQASAWPLRFLSPSLSFPAMYGGVLLAQETERRLGWRQSSTGGQALMEGLALALQLHAGAGLTKLALGAEGMRFFQAAELRAKNRQAALEDRPLVAGIYAMSENGFNNGSNGGRPPLRLVSSDPHEEFFQTFSKNRAFQESYHRILSHYGSRHEGNKLAALLLNSGVQHPAVMNPGLERLTGILVSKMGEADISYRDWLARKSYERVYFENRDPQALGALLRSLAADESGPYLEQRLSPHFPELDLRATERPINTLSNSTHFQLEVLKRQNGWNEFERSTAGMPLTEDARLVVYDWKKRMAEQHLGNMHGRLNDFLDRLCEIGEGPQATRINDVIEASGYSPLGAARLSRLESLLRLQNNVPPLEQLSDLKITLLTQ